MEDRGEFGNGKCDREMKELRIDEDDEQKMKKNKSKKKESPAKVPFLKLFSYADSWDYVLMFLGSIGACVHGASIPIFFVFFGKLINIIGIASLFPASVSHRVAVVSHS